ncbi:NACHT, LRR and PYD domains-containing protein 10-like [Sycon ciliatum]|uniref:NACHT, LRR and PYD domains-containing protein 10-like n=1 Tax=Sycon ciliatum TaxID=27933 RepID=UPI0031F5FBD8
MAGKETADVRGALSALSQTGCDERSASESGGREATCAEASSTVPEAVRRLKKMLVREYVGATVDMGEGMVEEGMKEPSVSDVQIRLMILSRPELRQEFVDASFDSTGDMWRVEHIFTKAADSLENILIESLFDLNEKQMKEFSSGRRTYRIVAVASAGCGKTFVFTRVAPLKWARNEMWTSFDLVIARKLRNREVREATDICALLGVGERGVFKDEERKSIDDFVREQAHRVCLVLDGLDEIRLGDCSGFVKDIVNGSNVKGLRLVVTSRPCVELLSLSEKKQFDRRVELVGFRQEDVEEYIGKVLRSVDEASILVEAVRQDQHLASMMATPFLAMQMCKMFHCRNGMLPKCLSDIFDMMIIQVAERNTGESYKSWNEISPAVQALILDLGNFAFNMLTQRRLIFTDTDLQMRAITGEAKALGLLVLADSSSRDDSRLWMFSHLTLQESLAARYVAVKKAATPARIVRLVELLGPETNHLRTFWMLLTAQLDKENAECLINGLLTRKKSIDGQGAAVNDENEE